MDKRRKLISVIALILVGVLLLGLLAGAVAPMVGAKSSTQIKQEIKDLENKQERIEDQLEELQAQRKENMDDMKDIVAQKNVIDQEIALIYEQMDNLNQQITVYNGLIADKQEELDIAEDRLAYLNEKNKERIRVMEERGTLSFWSVLIKSNSFFDFLDRMTMMREIAAADQRRLDEMNQVAKEIAAAKDELVVQKASVQAAKTKLDGAEAELETKRAEADALLAELSLKGEEYDALIEDAEDKNSALLDELAGLEADLDEAKEKEYQEWLAQQGAAGGGTPSGDWLVPCYYTRLTSPFGYRIHPIYKEWRFHSGVDLAAPLNTPIYATRSGIVTAKQYNSSAGNYVTIDHRDGFKSSYLHLTRSVVNVGDWVAAGQLIGYMGSTGASTGSHLHFSIYKNGEAVNPCNYVYLK